MLGKINTQPLFLITYKHGLMAPVEIQANDVNDAYRQGFAYYLKNSGFTETVDLKSRIETVVDTVTEIKGYSHEV